MRLAGALARGPVPCPQYKATENPQWTRALLLIVFERHLLLGLTSVQAVNRFDEACEQTNLKNRTVEQGRTEKL